MPRYPYKCEEHGEFEVVQSMKEDHDFHDCEKCGKVSARVWVTEFFADAKWPREDLSVEPEHWDKKKKEWMPRVFGTRKQQEAYYRANGLAQTCWRKEY